MVPKVAAGLLLALLPLAGANLAGRILADDGLPLPDSAAVELRCGDRAAKRSAVDRDGWFAFEGVPDHVDCAVAARAPGYRADTVPLSGLPMNPRIPALVLYRLGKGQGASMSVSHLSAPPAAVARFHAALRALRGGPGQDIELALGHLQSAVGAFPGYADAWFEIGRLHLASGSPGDAIGAFQEALRADPWLVSPYEPLILLLEAAGDPAGARQVCAGLRRINPALPEDCGRG